MIEIKCTKKQYNKLIDALCISDLDSEGKCFLGKWAMTCPALNTEPELSCRGCLKRHIKRLQEVRK